MGYSHRGGILIEVIIRDETSAKLDSFKSNGVNFPKIAGLLWKKYGIRSSFEKKDKDIDWLPKSDFKQ